ncbi:hypothetical protein [Brevibacillus sp. SYSU BS000544]|uniref:hypothetical protein n=1 Tax=Brevibacillus sp. SYSU BS000544 TaxID=3416443 RepID=UPI003CE53A0F
MKRLVVFGSFVLLLMVATPTWAEGQDNHGSHPSSEMPGMTNEEHQNMQHAPTTEDHTTEGNSTEGHSTEGHSTESGDHAGAGNEHSPTTDEPAAGGHGHGGPVVETPPNWGVLSAFAAINLLFILIGIWNKWTVRKAGA